MLQKRADKVVALDRCVICGSEPESVWDLPQLPLTDTFTTDPADGPTELFDQSLRFCGVCCHGQLGSIVSPQILYGGDYRFRTSASPTARHGTDFFLSVLSEVEPDRTFNCIVDLGCNDLFLLKKLAGRGRLRIGVDPIWQGREDGCEDSEIQVIGSEFADVDFEDLPEKPDLILCRHTLEHLANPAETIRRLLEIAADDALFLFEVPGFEPLVDRHRYDQVFHQHLQYFTQESFLRMLESVGASSLCIRSNYHDWGAFAVAFRRGAAQREVTPSEASPTAIGIREGIDLFLAQIAATKKTLSGLKGPIYGYGAAQMLPVLAYHLGTDLSFLEAVIDDDPAKANVRYRNLPVRIMPSSMVEGFRDSSVLITAVDSAQPILRRLFEDRPKHIVYPFNII